VNGVTALVGGQFGSEGKGLIAGHIAHEYYHHVRVGAANAGHTVYTVDHVPFQGDAGLEHYGKHVMQSIPCAAYANPDASLYIGPGALISPDIFLEELSELDTWRRIRDMSPAMVYVDRRAHVVTQEQIDREQLSDLAVRIGSTSTIAKEGIGVAQAARVMREEACVPAWEWFGDTSLVAEGLVMLTDVPFELASAESVLLEGTQGTGLSLTTGPFPYVTSRNTTAAGLLADCGVAPTRLDRVIIVCRTFPIRVAGNSGPFYPDSREIAWNDIGINPEQERTTVTKKIRRVATFSHAQVAEAVVLNGATEIALTFCDYIDPNLFGVSGDMTQDELEDYPETSKMVEEIETNLGIAVRFLGTGPHSVVNLKDE
jgi:adenylosuccinate synthase